MLCAAGLVRIKYNVFYMLTGTEGAGSTVNILALLAKLFISAGWDMNSLWSVESFPTVVRYVSYSCTVCFL